LRVSGLDQDGFRGTIVATLRRQESPMPKTRVLIVYRAKGDVSDLLARQLVLALRREGVEADAYEADEVPDLEGYDGVALEGAREGAGWTLFARDFARRHASELKMLPAWFLPSTPRLGCVEVREQTWWAHAIARWLARPPAESGPIVWPGTRSPPGRHLPN
jgi:hypothetical protein